MKIKLKIEKSNDDLIVKLPDEISKILNISAGDILEAAASVDGQLIVQKKISRIENFHKLASFNIHIDEDFKFDRDEIYKERCKL